MTDLNPQPLKNFCCFSEQVRLMFSSEIKHVKKAMFEYEYLLSASLGRTKRCSIFKEKGQYRALTNFLFQLFIYLDIKIFSCYGQNLCFPLLTKYQNSDFYTVSLMLLRKKIFLILHKYRSLCNSSILKAHIQPTLTIWNLNMQVITVSAKLMHLSVKCY